MKACATAVALVALLMLAPVSARAAGRPIRLVSADGTPLAAMLYEAPRRPAPAVVLVHMYLRSQVDWDGLATRLQAGGMTALAVDLRGHGASGGNPAPSRAMAGDVSAAVAWLGAQPGAAGPIAIVGASLGAGVGLLAAVDAPAVRGVALLSPSLDYRGLRIDASLVRRLDGRPVFLAASARDPYALRTIRDLVEGDSGPVEQRVSDAPAHGTALLAADPGVESALVDWLRRTLIF